MDRRRRQMEAKVVHRERGIYFETKPAVLHSTHGQHHAYLVYHDGKGGSEVIRGGIPNDTIVPDDGAVMFLFGGDISVETGKSMENSEDKYEEAEKPNSRPSRKLNIPPDELDDTWARMREVAEKIGRGEFDYDLATGVRWAHIGQIDISSNSVDVSDIAKDPNVAKEMANSNSVIGTVLAAVGYPVKDAIPEGVSKNVLGGIETILLKPSELSKEVGKAGRRPPAGVPEDDRQPSMPDRPPVAPDIEGNLIRERLPDDLDRAVAGRFGDAPAAARDVLAKAPHGNILVDRGGTGGRKEVPLGPGDDIRAFLRKFVAPGDWLDEVLLKNPRDWTLDERTGIMRHAAYDTPTDPRYGEARDRVGDWFRSVYGSGPIDRDATGRQTRPSPVRTPPFNPVPARTARGAPLDAEIRGLGLDIAKRADKEGVRGSVRRLQGALNRVGADAAPASRPAAPSDTAFPRVSPLLEDGVFGPRTKRALRRTVARRGAAAVRAAFDRPPPGGAL